jgi:hypothetical protein
LFTFRLYCSIQQKNEKSGMLTIKKGHADSEKPLSRSMKRNQNYSKDLTGFMF